MNSTPARAAAGGLLLMGILLSVACSPKHVPAAPKPDYIAPPPETHATLTPPPPPAEPPKLGDAPRLPPE